MAHILIVEDEAMIRRMLYLRLKARGHTLEECENGRIAVEKALGGSFDLILMDMHMPEMDGHEATMALRRKGYSGLIIAVTASVLDHDTHKAIQAGCNKFIPKPIGADFEDQIETLLRGG